MNPLRARLQQLFIPLLRHTRPAVAGRPPRPRHFNSKTPLLLVHRSPARPQIPFFTRAKRRSPTIARLLSTEQVASIKYQIKLGLYWVALSWTALGGGYVAYLFLRQDWLDKQFPSPKEWQLVVKYLWRQAKYEELESGPQLGVTDWGKAATSYRAVAGLLEDYRAFGFHTPSGIAVQVDWDRSIPGLSDEVMRSPPEHTAMTRIGYDVSMKSESWRRGYHEAMLGAARGGEQLVGWMTHRESNIGFPPHQVRSEQNPNPVPFPPGFHLDNPDERDCEPSFESPDFHYIRLLTTKGFSRKQRLEAGIHYASWLDRSDRPETAERMLHWCLSLAQQGLPEGATFVNDKTGVIAQAAPFVTHNLLSASTAMATHFARHEKIPQALSIYLSILRARRNAPDAAVQYLAKGQDYSLHSIDSIMGFMASLARTGQFPDDPTSGDEPFQRTKNSACDEAAVMAYVGEILFARADRRAEGLSWTRDATSIAEAGHADTKLDRASKDVCTQCLETGLTNWLSMVGLLASEKQERQQGANRSKSRWLWSGSDEGMHEEADWSEEERLVKRKKQRFDEERLTKRLDAAVAHTSKLFAI